VKTLRVQAVPRLRSGSDVQTCVLFCTALAAGACQTRCMEARSTRSTARKPSNGTVTATPAQQLAAQRRSARLRRPLPAIRFITKSRRHAKGNLHKRGFVTFASLRAFVMSRRGRCRLCVRIERQAGGEDRHGRRPSIPAPRAPCETPCRTSPTPSGCGGGHERIDRVIDSP
jgi:hypothetical protein